MGKHTPGPWHWHEGWGAVVAGDDPKRNPDMLVTPIWRQGSTAWGDEENNANARLIAASPALYEALKECITSEGAACFGDMKNHPEWMQRRLYAIADIARAALAKADGRGE